MVSVSSCDGECGVSSSGVYVSGDDSGLGV